MSLHLLKNPEGSIADAEMEESTLKTGLEGRHKKQEASDPVRHS